MRGHPSFWLSFATGVLNSYASTQDDMKIRKRDKYSLLALNTGFLFLRTYNANEYTISPYPVSKFFTHLGVTGVMIGSVYCGGHLFGNMLFKNEKVE